MMLVNSANISYGLSIATFVSGRAEWKIHMSRYGLSTSHVGLVRQAAEPSPLTGERGWFVFFKAPIISFILYVKAKSRHVWYRTELF